MCYLYLHVDHVIAKKLFLIYIMLREKFVSGTDFKSFLKVYCVTNGNMLIMVLVVTFLCAIGCYF